MPTIQKLPLGRLQTNCYILCENPEDGVVVIDPGDCAGGQKGGRRADYSRAF